MPIAQLTGEDAAGRKTLQASTTQTASGFTPAIEVGEYREMIAMLNVSAASGTTPSLAVKLQTSDDGGTTWYDIPGAAFTAATAVTAQAIQVNTFGDVIRAAYTITGTTPSFTFLLDAVLKI